MHGLWQSPVRARVYKLSKYNPPRMRPSKALRRFKLELSLSHDAHTCSEEGCEPPPLLFEEKTTDSFPIHEKERIQGQKVFWHYGEPLETGTSRLSG